MHNLLLSLLFFMPACAQQTNQPLVIQQEQQAKEVSVFTVRIHNCNRFIDKREDIIQVFKDACDYSFMEQPEITIEDLSPHISYIYIGNKNGCATLRIDKSSNTCTVEFCSLEDMCDYMRFVGYYSSEMHAIMKDKEFEDLLVEADSK